MTRNLRSLRDRTRVLHAIHEAPGRVTVAALHERPELARLTPATIRRHALALAAAGKVRSRKASRRDPQPHRDAWGSALFGGAGTCIRRYWEFWTDSSADPQGDVFEPVSEPQEREKPRPGTHAGDVAKARRVLERVHGSPASWVRRARAAEREEAWEIAGKAWRTAARRELANPSGSLFASAEFTAHAERCEGLAAGPPRVDVEARGTSRWCGAWRPARVVETRSAPRDGQRQHVRVVFTVGRGSAAYEREAWQPVFRTREEVRASGSGGFVPRR